MDNATNPPCFEDEFPEAAAYIQERYAARKPLFQVVSQPAPGRNDPCPCMSGLKHKKCCAGSLQERAGRLIALTNRVAEARQARYALDAARDDRTPDESPVGDMLVALDTMLGLSEADSFKIRTATNAILSQTKYARP